MPPGRRRPARRGRHLPGRRRRQGHRDLLRHRQRGRRVVRLLARRRLRLRRLGRLRPQGHGHHRPRRLGVGQAALPRARPSTPRPRTSPSSASATCPATCSATACCSPSTSGWSPPSTTGTSSSTRTRTRPPRYAERRRLFELPRSCWADYDTELISAGGGVFPRTAKAIPVTAQMRAALGIEDERRQDDPGRPDEGDPAGAGGPAVERRHRHVRQGRRPRRNADVGDKANDADPGRRRRPAGQGRRRGRQPGPDPARPDRVRAARRQDQHRRHRQLRRRGHLRPRGEHQDPAQRPGRATAT